MSKADIADSGTPFILYGELYTTYGEIAYQINRKTEKIVDKKYYSKIGDVVVPTSGETAEEISTATCIMKDDVILAGDLNILRGSKIDGRILSYLLNHKKKYEIASVAQGASIIHIKADDIKKIKINVPCKTEQEKIASFLTSIDNLISTQESNISILETYNRGLISKIFKQEIRFKDANGNEFPDWTEKTFEELADYKKGPFGSALKKEIFVPKSNTTKKVYEQQHAIEKDCTIERYFITDKYYEKMKSFSVKKGDIIISCAGTIGEIYVLPSNAEDGIINQALMRVRINNNVIDQKFFITLFDNMISTKGKKLSNGSALKNIPPFADLKKQIALVPCLEEQQKIANCLSAIDKVVEQEKVYLEKLKTIKKGLLQQMFV